MPAGQNRNQTVRIRRANSRRRRKPSGGGIAFRLFLLGVLVIAVAGGALYIKKYAPTREHMPLEEYYTYFFDDEAVLVVDDVYAEPEEGDTVGKAIVQDGRLYLSADSTKELIDDGYVLDDEESVLRYVTDDELISASYDSPDYEVNGKADSMDAPIAVTAHEQTYLLADFVMQYSDFSYTLSERPYRAVIYNAGFERNVSNIRWKTAVRRLGGPKSKVLEDVKRGEQVSVIQNHGSWSNVVTEDGVIGYVKNSKLEKVEKKVEEARLPEREYQHMTFPERLTIGWNVVTFAESNAGLTGILDQTEGLDVICPTWFRLNDNEGGISDISSKEYVDTCHDGDLLVWGLVSDFEDPDADVETVLNRTSHRDALIDNLMNAVSETGLDGINVDFEMVPIEAADGYIEFIKELSLRCEEAEIYLSVDNYIPAPYNMYYNRSVQADYADYCIVMAYDEYHRSGEEAGSNASLPFVKEAIKSTLLEVPKEQLVLGMPFFCREWVDENGTLSSEEYAMDSVGGYLERHDLKKKWNEELGQNYVEYTDGDAKHMLWIEDEKSLSKKLALMKEKDLAGGAFWRLGFEPESVWSVVGEYE